jgi:hypothetical protein
MPPPGIAVAQLDDALTQLASASAGIRRRILTACAACVAADGTVTVREAELLRTVSDGFGCPLPPFLDISPVPGTDALASTSS